MADDGGEAAAPSGDAHAWVRSPTARGFGGMARGSGHATRPQANRPNGPIATKLLNAIHEKKKERVADHKTVAEAIFKNHS